MARPANFTEDMINVSKQIVKVATTARELRTGLSVLIPKLCSVSNAETAQVLGVGIATVVRMQRRIRDQVEGKPVIKESWGGGRRRQNLTLQEEAEFLNPKFLRTLNISF